MVMEFPAFSVYVLSLGATKSQFAHAPSTSPITIQAPLNPVENMAPGSPIKSHPLISAAPALSAVTAGPKERPRACNPSDLTSVCRRNNR